jgi:hypothetical protein
MLQEKRWDKTYSRFAADMTVARFHEVAAHLFSVFSLSEAFHKNAWCPFVSFDMCKLKIWLKNVC